jgi:hypothetical protein
MLNLLKKRQNMNVFCFSSTQYATAMTEKMQTQDVKISRVITTLVFLPITRSRVTKTKKSLPLFYKQMKQLTLMQIKKEINALIISFKMFRFLC